MSTDVANTTPKTLDLDELMARGAVTQQNVQALLKDADFIVGRTLADKETLVGTPLVITRVVFRNTAPKTPKAPALDYVSVEYTTISNDPGRCVDGVFNDGSTGVRRQLVNYLATKGIIKPPANPDEALAEVPTKADGTSADVVFDITLVAPRGLRRSDYVVSAGPAAGQAATTFYLS